MAGALADEDDDEAEVGCSSRTIAVAGENVVNFRDQYRRLIITIHCRRRRGVRVFIIIVTVIIIIIFVHKASLLDR